MPTAVSMSTWDRCSRHRPKLHAAVENDVNIMGVSSLAAGHKTLIPQVIEELKRVGTREDIMVIAGGVIPAQDYDFLYKAGVAAIFGPGTSVAKAACEMMKILLDKE